MIFLSTDATVVSKTTSAVSLETKQPTDKDKGQDSGSDYGGDWSEDDWNDAQVRENTSLPLGGAETGYGGDWSEERVDGLMSS